MDVRCEKCQTEYELDESKVTEAGVTVKCTSCGNLFKIRRRASSAQPASAPTSPSETPNGERLWLLRSPGGDIRKFRELTQLQQWIVERRVTRECEISRTGETWKKLSDIAELSSFFQVVEHAQATLKAQTGTRNKTTLTANPPNVPPAKPLSVPGAPVRPSASGAAQAPAFLAASPAARRDEDEGLAQEPAWAAGRAEPRIHPSRTTDEPDLAPARNLKAERAAPLTDPDRFRMPSGGFDDSEAVDEIGVRRARVPHYLGVILLAGAAGFAIWYFGLRQPGEQPAAAVATDAGSAQKPTVTAMTARDAAPAAASQPAAAPAPASDQLYREALGKLAEDTDEAFAAAEKLLDRAHVADAAQEARVLAALALIEATWAQYLDDDADAATDQRVAGEARAEASRKLTRAEKYLKDAQAKAPAAPEVLLAAAEADRQKKVPADEIEKRLEPAGIRAETLYQRGMVKWRDGKTGDAEMQLIRAVEAHALEFPGTTHLRARWRLALIAMGNKRPDAAKVQIDAMLAAQPNHPRARTLAARIATPATVVTTPPAPPPDKPVKPDKPERKPVLTPEDNNGPVTAAAYAGLVDKGNKLAENGNCGEAIKIFERALDARPSGVEALTGLGYCFLDRRDYPQALGSFRAALGISPHHSEALIGMADTYRGQGNKAQAAEYYRRYLEANPSGSRAAAARRFLDEAAPAPPPPPPPQPAPAPKPEPPPPEKEKKEVQPLPSDKLPDKPVEPEPAPQTP